jgi:hypothetical protein
MPASWYVAVGARGRVKVRVRVRVRVAPNAGFNVRCSLLPGVCA